MSATSSEKILPIDGLRGIAIALVMAYHFRTIGPNPELKSTVEQVFNGLVGSGWIGVDLFFVISGFLITGILLRMKDSPHYYRKFWIRRALRILPLYFVFLAIVLFTLPIVDKNWQQIKGEVSPWWYLTFLSNLFYSIRGNWVSGALDPTWSISIEEQFYWIWPLAVAALSRSKLRSVCISLMAFAFCLRFGIWGWGLPPIHGYVFTLCRADALAAGGWLALALASPDGRSV